MLEGCVWGEAMNPRTCYVCKGSILTSYDRSRKKYRCMSLKRCQERVHEIRIQKGVKIAQDSLEKFKAELKTLETKL